MKREGGRLCEDEDIQRCHVRWEGMEQGGV